MRRARTCTACSSRTTSPRPGERRRRASGLARRCGAAQSAAAWLPGLAASAGQGPFSQGHYADGTKAPPHEPYILDWACSSSGAFADLVIQGFFGVDVPLDGSAPRATPQLADADPGARLRNLVVAGRAYDVTADGLEPSAG